MQVKIRPFNSSWHRGEQFEWQTLDKNLPKGKWYHLWSKNILRYPYGIGELRREAGIETHYIMSALLVGLAVQCRATYDKRSRKLYVMGPNGGDTKQ